MPDDGSRHQIMLLPADNYWDWVDAIRGYAVKYRTSVTAYPQNAVRYHRPHQVITVVDTPDAYAEYGRIDEWLYRHAPEVQVDSIYAETPAELKQTLDERIETGERFGMGVSERIDAAELPFHLRWPTGYPVITQPFGANPAIYRRWGLPGHEGIDFRAPMNSPIYACADGEVYMVHDGRGGHPYGIHVRVRHAGGYKTIYGHLNQALVYTGQMVKEGDQIGLAGRTGNSASSHLHLSLEKNGASANGLTSYPSDIIDPTPFLLEKPEGEAVTHLPDWWEADHCLVGLHARIGGEMEAADWSVVEHARIEALKFTSEATNEDIARARDLSPDMFLLAQLTTGFSGAPVSAREFVERVKDDAIRLYNGGVEYFEIHDAPNLMSEGYGTGWQNGNDFGEWFVEVVGRLRAVLPGARFGWPGLLPGPTIPGIRVDHRAFLESAHSAVALADWIGCQCHWTSAEELLDEDGGLAYQIYRERWPDRLLLVTEFSNPSPSVSDKVKAEQYVQFLDMVQHSSDVGAAFGFVVSSAVVYPAERWRTEEGEETAIVTAVGGREDD